MKPEYPELARRCGESRVRAWQETWRSENRQKLAQAIQLEILLKVTSRPALSGKPPLQHVRFADQERPDRNALRHQSRSWQCRCDRFSFRQQFVNCRIRIARFCRNFLS